MPSPGEKETLGARLRRFTRLPGRILALSAATFIGALGAVALTAAPASAHTTKFESKFECVENKPFTAKVSWTLTNDWNQSASLSEVRFQYKKTETPVEVGAIKNGATFDGRGDTLVGTYEFDTRQEAPFLRATVTWGDKKNEKVKDQPTFTPTDCAPKEEPPAKKPTFKAVSNCDGTQTVTIKNTSDAERKFAVNGEKVGDVDWVDRKDLKVGDEWVVTVPKEHAGIVRVKWKLPKEKDWEDKEPVRFAKPDTCFTAASESTCDDLKITVTNTGAKAIKAAVTVGGKTEEETINPDETAVYSIEGVDGLVAKLTINGGTPKEFEWTNPLNCGGGGGGLPVTGTNAGLLAGGAMVLVAGGGGLFFMARRRRIRFAA